MQDSHPLSLYPAFPVERRLPRLHLWAISGVRDTEIPMLTPCLDLAADQRGSTCSRLCSWPKATWWSPPQRAARYETV